MDLNFLFNKQYINHIEDYIANHIDDPTNIAPFLDLHQAALKEKQFVFSVETLFTLILQSQKRFFLVSFSLNIIKEVGQNEHIAHHSEAVA